MIDRDENLELGRILGELRLVDPDELDRALLEHHRTGERLDSLLLKMNLLSEENLLRAVAQQLHLRFMRLNEGVIPEAIVSRVPARLATHYHIMPVGAANGVIEVAMNDPRDIHLLDDLRLNLKSEIEPVVATRADIAAAIKAYYGIGADTMQEMIDEGDQPMDISAQEVEDVESMAGDASIVQFVRQIFLGAITDRANDIHVEPMEDDLRIRYRIDGVLYEVPVPPTSSASSRPSSRA